MTSILYEVTYIAPNGYSVSTMRVLATSPKEAREEVEARTGCIGIRHSARVVDPDA